MKDIKGTIEVFATVHSNATDAEIHAAIILNVTDTASVDPPDGLHTYANVKYEVLE